MGVMRIREWLKRRLAPSDGGEAGSYWELRAQRFGTRAVYNLGHAPEQIDQVDRKQRSLLLPLLREDLRVGDDSLLDFGCGTGRFSGTLAEITGCQVTAVDPTASLVALAPVHRCVRYLVVDGSTLPFDDAFFGIVWICLVLGAIRGGELSSVVAEINRVLRPGGLLFLVENTSDKPDSPSWALRSINAYSSLCPDFRMQCRGEYDDLGERISILSGRKYE
jgi:ubiquinone/menaquinone biosynthesis C-methylase UbiE